MVRPGYFYFTYHTVRFSIPVPYIYTVWVPGYKLWGTIPIPGHHEPRIGIRWVTKSYRIPIPHYVPPKIGIYYTYLRVPDLIPTVHAASTMNNSEQFSNRSIPSIGGGHYEFNWNKITGPFLGLSAVLYGYQTAIQYGASAPTPKGKKEKLNRGIFLIDRGRAILNEAWYDPLYIWIPNYRSNNMVLRAS